MLVCMCSSPCTGSPPDARHKHTQTGCTQTNTRQGATTPLFTSPGGLAATTTSMTCGPPALRRWHHHEALTVVLLSRFLKVPCSARFSLAAFSCDDLTCYTGVQDGGKRLTNQDALHGTFKIQNGANVSYMAYTQSHTFILLCSG